MANFIEIEYGGSSISAPIGNLLSAITDKKVKKNLLRLIARGLVLDLDVSGVTHDAWGSAYLKIAETAVDFLFFVRMLEDGSAWEFRDSAPQEEEM